MQRTCANHPDRRAIGVCIITGKAICGECSTRYEGVNYSKEGLEILKRQREAERSTSPASRWLVRITALVASPVMLLGLFASYLIIVRLLMDLRQWSS